MFAAKASRNLGLDCMVCALAWPYVYLAAAPRRLIEEAFKELAKRWKPILNLRCDDAGVDVALKSTRERMCSMARRLRCFSML